MKKFNNKKGFTLIEVLLYTAIFAIVGGLTTGILLTVTQVQQRESASAEVTGQLNFVMQRLRQIVSESSNIEIPTSTTPSTLLKLRMQATSTDPTFISLSGNAIQLKEGSSATTTLTSDRVIVDTLNFKKFTQYPGHDTLSLDIQMTYNSQNPKSRVQRTLSSAIARVSAATFDSNLLPGATSYTIGQSGSTWQNVFVGDGSITSPSYSFGADTNTGIFRPGADILGFTTNSTERMRIDASGNVGIGTTGPIGPLHIVYPYARTDTTERTATVWSSNDTDSNRNLLILSSIGTAGAQSSRVWKLQTGQEGLNNLGNLALQVDGGNVGIGTTGPTNKLQVEGGNVYIPVGNSYSLNLGGGTGGTRRLYTYDGGGGNIAGFGVDLAGIGYEMSQFFAYGTSDNGTLTFGSHDGTTYRPKMTIKGSGKVGIGTASPEAFLDVEAPTDIGAAAIGPSSSATGARSIALGYGASVSGNDSVSIGSNFTVSGVNSVGIAIANMTGTTLSAANVMSIMGGNVGIGTTNPGYKLEVNGDIKIPTGNAIYLAADKKIINYDTAAMGAVNFFVHPWSYSPHFAFRSILDNALWVGITNGYTTFYYGHGDSSSRTLKTNITPIDNALDKVLQLNGVYFDWIASGKHDIGMIAEDVENIIPEVVYRESTSTLALSYDRLTALTVQAIKEQQQQIEELKSEIKELKSCPAN